MSLKVYIGGKLYDKADAKISVYDHGLLYGDGVFEGIRSYAGRVVQAVDVLREAEDAAGIGTDAFEDAVAVEQAVVVDADLGVGLVVELAADVDLQAHPGVSSTFGRAAAAPAPAAKPGRGPIPRPAPRRAVWYGQPAGKSGRRG